MQNKFLLIFYVSTVDTKKCSYPEKNSYKTYFIFDMFVIDLLLSMERIIVFKMPLK